MFKDKCMKNRPFYGLGGYFWAQNHCREQPGLADHRFPPLQKSRSPLAFFPHFTVTQQNVSSGTGDLEQSLDITTSKDPVTLARCAVRRCSLETSLAVLPAFTPSKSISSCLSQFRIAFMADLEREKIRAAV
jgi:hypothetical protein